MSKCLVLLGGDLGPADWVDKYISNPSYIIAADGGARHANSLGLQLSHLVGDFDSIDPVLLDSLRKSGVKVQQYDTDKNATDGEIALDLALELGATVVHILGNEGGRFDHLQSGVMLLANEKYAGLKIWIYQGSFRSTLLRSDQELVLEPGLAGKKFSLIPISEKVEGVDLFGARWPLRQDRLSIGSSRSLCNEFTDTELKLSIKKGLLLVALEGQ